jgi:hypothetical protein
VAAGSEDFHAITKLRGKRPLVGNSGNITVTEDELLLARQAYGLARSLEAAA